MAFYKGSFRAPSLDLYTHLNIILPTDEKEKMPEEYRDKAPKVLVALHGISGNADSWLNFTQIAWYAYHYNIAVVSVEAPRSFYTDMPFGLDYATYIGKDLVSMLSDTFKLDTSRGNLFIGGLSMGGYGSCMLALTYPEVFGGCVSFSFGGPDNGKSRSAKEKELVASFGPDVLEGRVEDKYSIGKLASKTAQLPLEQRPKIYLACGTEDHLYPRYKMVVEAFEKSGMDFRHEEWAGVHDYPFWDTAMKKAMKIIRDEW